MKIVVAENFRFSTDELRHLLKHFDERGKLLGKGDRNKIKIIEHEGKILNVKSFKVPNPVNKVAYKFFRKSKAQRSFEYAHRLLQKGIGTPQPLAYVEQESVLSFGKSFYVSEQLDYDLTFRDLALNPEVADRSELLKAFTRFTFQLHEAEVEFLDHSPGNTLIIRNDAEYSFFLVDLNRMNFKKLTFEERMKNFSRLTSKEEVVRIMASEYSKLVGRPEAEVFERMWLYTREFQRKFYGKKELKRKLKFWKRSGRS